MGIFSKIASVASSAAPYIGAISSAFGAYKANKAGEANVQQQMAFQRESAQNSYQWAMEDMRKAGLNPMLAYQQGGASAMSGASFRPQNELASAPAAVTSGMQATRLKAELKNINMDTEVKRATEQNTRSSSTKAIQDTANMVIQNQILQENLHSAKSNAEQAKQATSFFKTKGGRVVKMLDLIGRGLNPFASTGTSAKSLLTK